MPVQNGDGIYFENIPSAGESLPKEKCLRERLERLKSEFSHKFDTEPTVYLRVPGRVNLIGEHVDYCGYSVCPMALQQDILVAFRPLLAENQKPFLSLCNQEKDKYKDHIVEDCHFRISFTSMGWASYILCGVRKVIEVLEKQNKEPLGMKMIISGNIPPGSGLSSSSALVCAGVLATALTNNLELSKEQLASLSAEAEHYVGTVGGGMDQAIIFLASEGCAKLIEFNPLRTRDVSLPPGAVFVVAHCLATKNKAASNDFNTRVVECRLASQILAKKKNLPWEKCLRLAEFQALSGLTLNEVILLVKNVFHETPYSKAEVCEILEVSEDQLKQLSLTPNTEQVDKFKLYQRSMHVFQEAKRVAQFEAGCREGWSLAQLGLLMTESHKSLRDLYECSHEQLDRLVDTAMSAGALGARLTGAGWGGCVVALTTEDHRDKFISTIKEKFYYNNIEAEEMKICVENSGLAKETIKTTISDNPSFENVIFATQPGQGVQIFNFSTT